ncbi:HupE/UreJ family protein [Scleromatobacter humisilvae]|uniref:HupE/UreJ family protein n=1 Tax=Scleromatobacter humisilvae TaxID=2897159 RepID=A0A9X2C3V8_9BURK|nr:HupE/UreJ family protein [Scleromatobacter humisilvae]MCK9688145.1 HupE/UreJ family protein [Scleromatobacter humisilvae]
MKSACLAALLVALAPFAQAHKASDAYVTLHVDGATVAARIDIALRDLDRDLDLDTNADDQLSWKEVRTRWADIAALARNDIRLSADGARCTPDAASTPVTDANTPALTEHSDGTYAVLRTQWHCAAPVQALSVEYELFAKTDPTHRGIARVSRADADAGTPQLAVLSPGNGWHRFKLPPLPTAPAASGTSADFVETPAPVPVPAAAPKAQPDANADTASADDAPASSFFGFVREGVHHILIGYDHILFLLSLLLPAVWIRSAVTDPRTGVTRTRWVPSANLRLALANVLKVVTAFTVAHSITLALSVLDVVDPPSRWVESIIAASVVLAALNNIWPLISEARWKLTFVFGLVHGFGFASALKDAGLAKGALAGPLVGFNVGVEIGQLCIVALVLPVAWSLRGTRTYRGAFAGGSLLIAGVAGLWLVQRAFDLSLIAG